MLKENQLVTTRWNPYTQRYYQSKGYEYTGRGQEFLVKIEDLLQGSHAKVVVICDFCGKEYTKIYKDYFAQHNGGDCCVSCGGQKSLIAGEDKYGKGHRGRTLKRIAQERYGVDNVAKCPDIQEKIKNTNINRYGVDSLLRLNYIHEKSVQFSHTEDATKKREQTNLERYGYKYGLSSPQIREKIVATYYNNNTIPTSAQQIELNDKLTEIYGNCQMNYPCGSCFLDCVIEVDGIKIDVEYDGAYWHQDQQRDIRRDEFVKSQGYKVYRIIGSHYIPDDETLKQQINTLLITKKKFVKTIMA